MTSNGVMTPILRYFTYSLASFFIGANYATRGWS